MNGIEKGVELVRQSVWGDLIALYLFLGGLGAMAFLFSYLAWRRGASRKLVLGGSLTGLISVLIGILALILDLGRPGKFVMVILSPRLNVGSWIVVGSLLLLLFVVFSVLFTLPLLMRKEDELRKLMGAFGILGSVAGVGVALYTGILIGVVEAVPFWHTPALPILFLVSAASTGLAVYDVIMMPTILRGGGDGIDEYLSTFARWDSYAIILELLILAIYLLVQAYGQEGSVASVRTLLSGDLAPIFHFLVVWLGLLIPAALILLPSHTSGSRDTGAYLTLLSGIMVLIGGFTLRYVILRAGYLQVPLT